MTEPTTDGRAPRPDTAGPLRVRIPADLETPVSVFLKLQPLGACFLFESVERGIQVGRYSFIGMKPHARLALRDGVVTIERNGLAPARVERVPVDPDDPFAPVRAELARQPDRDADGDLPPAFGGAVGYIGYDMVRYFEPVSLPERAGDADLPDYQFLLPGTLAVFDHVRNEITFLTTPSGDDAAAAAAARDELERLLAALRAPLPPDAHRPLAAGGAAPLPELASNLDQASFETMVRRAQEHILAGDAFQIVLSQRLAGETTAPPFRIYRALRSLNPSPYLFYLDCGDAQLVGSSPEMLVQVAGGRARVNPIAGTRRRGATPAEDHALEHELLADQKERAEHVMLVDLGRNDLGRVCRTGTVQVDDFMSVERYSHVMHIVSRVSGQLEPGRDVFDVLAATFPAGTVSGAPKIRAMQIISELEPDRRGPYAGAVGWFGRNGDMDMCIAIRTLVMRGGRFSLQAGAGIVADSRPDREYRETLDKLRALVRAVADAGEEA